MNNDYDRFRMQLMPRPGIVLPWNDSHPDWHQPGDDSARAVRLQSNLICRHLAGWPVDQRARAVTALVEIALDLHPAEEPGRVLILYRQYLDGINPLPAAVRELREACAAIHEPAVRAWLASPAGRRKIRADPLTLTYRHAAGPGPTAALAGVAISMCSAIMDDGAYNVFCVGAEPGSADHGITTVFGACSTTVPRAGRVGDLWRRWWRVVRCRLAFCQ